jgi:RNA polymerase sigma-B factor
VTPANAAPRSDVAAVQNDAVRAAEERRLFQRLQRFGDRSARDQLVERFMPLAAQLARRYRNTSQSFEDLLQVANLGLVQAVDRFDAERGLRFSSFAVPTILGELRRHFRDTGWALHIPRSLQERSRHVGTGLNELSARLGRSPTIAELAEWSGLSREDVIEGLDVRLAYETSPLDAPGQSDDDGWGARLGAEDDALERVEDTAMLERTMRSLPERERLLLHLRFAEDLSQSEIARRVGVSQMHVSRLLRRAVGRLRAAAAADEARFGAFTAG